MKSVSWSNLFLVKMESGSRSTSYHTTCCAVCHSVHLQNLQVESTILTISFLSQYKVKPSMSFLKRIDQSKCFIDLLGFWVPKTLHDIIRAWRPSFDVYFVHRSGITSIQNAQYTFVYKRIIFQWNGQRQQACVQWTGIGGGSLCSDSSTHFDMLHVEAFVLISW